MQKVHVNLNLKMDKLQLNKKFCMDGVQLSVKRRPFISDHNQHLGISFSINITTNRVKFYFFDNDDMKPSKLQVSFK